MNIKLFNRFLNEELPADGPEAGLTTAPPVEAAPVDTPPTEFAGPEWMKGISQDLMEDKSLQNFKDVNDLAKSYIHSRKQIGKNKISLPDEHGTDEDWKEVYKQLGLPERDKYSVKFGEANYSEDFKKGFIDQAHNAGILPQQAEKVFEFFNSQVTIASQEAGEANELEQQEAFEGLKKEWGSGYDKKLKTAQVAFSTFADEDLTAYLNDTGLAQDTNLIKLFSKIGEKLNEDTFDTNTVKHLGLTKEDAEEKKATMMGDSNHPYWKDEHPNHNKAVEDMLKYNKIIES